MLRHSVIPLLLHCCGSSRYLIVPELAGRHCCRGEERLLRERAGGRGDEGRRRANERSGGGAVCTDEEGLERRNGNCERRFKTQRPFAIKERSTRHTNIQTGTRWPDNSTHAIASTQPHTCGLQRSKFFGARPSMPHFCSAEQCCGVQLLPVVLYHHPIILPPNSRTH